MLLASGATFASRALQVGESHASIQKPALGAITRRRIERLAITLVLRNQDRAKKFDTCQRRGANFSFFFNPLQTAILTFSLLAA
jgi:hypothetical protein